MSLHRGPGAAGTVERWDVSLTLIHTHSQQSLPQGRSRVWHYSSPNMPRSGPILTVWTEGKLNRGGLDGLPLRFCSRELTACGWSITVFYALNTGVKYSCAVLYIMCLTVCTPWKFWFFFNSNFNLRNWICHLDKQHVHHCHHIGSRPCSPKSPKPVDCQQTYSFQAVFSGAGFSTPFPMGSAATDCWEKKMVLPSTGLLQGLC